MITFDVLNRFSGSVQFTAEIECSKDAARSIKLGLAIRWGVKNRANLAGANLAGANLAGTNLAGAYLARANLAGAELAGAYLAGAYLAGANLAGAYLAGAYLAGANLARAYLAGTNLAGANLAGANLAGAELAGASGINDWVKCIQIDQYPISYTDSVMQIGCERHSIADWRDFDDERIFRMDGKSALKFWRKYKEWIFSTVEICPAEATGSEKVQ